jgi:hypothetical protein
VLAAQVSGRLHSCPEERLKGTFVLGERVGRITAPSGALNRVTLALKGPSVVVMMLVQAATAGAIPERP